MIKKSDPPPRKRNLINDIIKFITIMAFTLAMLALIFSLASCQTKEKRAERICNYFGGIRQIIGDLVICRDGSEWTVR